MTAKSSGTTPLSAKVEQMLTEAAVIIPGCQALLGFQLIAMLTSAFDELPMDAKFIHAAGLCCVTIATILLMTPAALHRQSFGGDELGAVPAPRLRLRYRSIAAAGAGHRRRCLCGLSQNSHSTVVTLAASLTLLFAMLLLWYLYPMWLRARRA